MKSLLVLKQSISLSSSWSQYTENYWGNIEEAGTYIKTTFLYILFWKDLTFILHLKYMKILFAQKENIYVVKEMFIQCPIYQPYCHFLLYPYHKAIDVHSAAKIYDIPALKEALFVAKGMFIQCLLIYPNHVLPCISVSYSFC